MDILIHTLSGGITASGLTILQKNTSVKRKIGTTFLGCFMGALPDIDAISLWSKFDNTIGSFFNLTSGKVIYSAKFWYSHHAFFHSLICALLISLLVTGIISYFHRKRENIFLIPILFCSYCAHLLGDLPTPASSWGGINLFFPSKNYVGGFGLTWWWNNYDIFLILISGLFLNFVFLFIKKAHHFTGIGILALAFTLITYQLNTRNFYFAYTKNCPNYQGYEQKSKDIQKEILGPKVYGLMEKLDNKLPFYF